MPSFVRDRGIVYIVFGPRAADQAEQSIRALRPHNPWPIIVVGDQEPEGATRYIPVDRSGTMGESARATKVRLYAWSPYEQTLYLDADTRPRQSLDAGWAALDRGWDLAAAPSLDPAFGRLGADERGRLVMTLGARYAVPLNSGVIFFRRSDRLASFWRDWAAEWERYRGRDQGAMLLALQRTKPRVWLLGQPWNDRHDNTEAIVAHYFGAAA